LNVKRVLDSLNLDQIQTELTEHYHKTGPGRHPYNPLSMLKAQLVAPVAILKKAVEAVERDLRSL